MKRWVWLSVATLFLACGGGGSDGGDGTGPQNDTVTQPVGAAGGTVVTPSGAAGVQIPAGTFNQQVMVTITRLPASTSPGTGPLPTTLKQYGPFYDFTTSPQVAEFGDSARVGVCQVSDPSSSFYPPEPHDRLRLAHAVNGQTEILERVGVTDFLRCGNVSASRQLSGVSAIKEKIASIFRPGWLYAAHGGLGGKVKSFSPFGAVDPGAPSLKGRLVTTWFSGCALNAAGAAYCWGDMTSTGTGAPPLGGGIVTSPQPVLASPSFSVLAAGVYTVCGLTSANALYCWGENHSAQYGYGPSDTINSYTPRPAAPGLALKTVSAGGSFMCGVDVSGTTYCWGENVNGTLATGDLSNFKSGPVKIASPLSFGTVSASFGHACGLTVQGAGYCWGSAEGSGDLGNGGMTASATPVPVSGGLTFTSIVTGGFGDSCGIATTGTYCWGNNYFGQLGSNTANCTIIGIPNAMCPSAVPVKVSGNQTFVDVVVGERFGCALTAAGAAYCWGDNSTGELGNGTSGTIPVTTPTPVTGNLTFTTIAVGRQFACGAISNGSIYCWGQNIAGQVGQGSTTTAFYSTPQIVNGVSLK